MSMIFYLLMFLLGASVGSFLNVLVSRSVQGKDWVRGRSKCDHCGKTLAWYDMVPVFSYLVYRGKSRCCHAPLSLQHILVESLVGFLFVWWLLVGSLFFRLVSQPLTTIQPVFWLLLGLILMGIFVADLFYGLIPVTFVAIGTVLVVIYRMVLMASHVYQVKDLLWSILAAILAWAFFWFLRYVTKGKGMGDGDVILAFLLGLLLGWPKTIVWMWVSFVIGAVISLCLILVGVKKMRSTIPFGPFMIIGVWVTLVWGEKMLSLLY